MRTVSRRAVLAAGIGVAGAAAGGYGLVESGILPGKYQLAQLLGECGGMPSPPRGPLPAREEAVFWSAYRNRPVRMVTLLPAAPEAARALGVVIALHGLGSDALGAAGLYAPAMTAAGVTRFAVIAVDGGGTYWHRRADGDDPLGMISHEALPRAAARGLAVARIGIIGYSMGGYGALLLAERLAERLSAGTGHGARPDAGVAAVAAASPAIFASYQDARAADPGGFDDPADFARNDVLAGLPALRGVPAWVACGGTDPFEPVTQLLRSRLGELAGSPPAGGIEAGCHDEAFWARSAPAGLRFLARHVHGPRDGGVGLTAAPGGQPKRDA
jgi:S-formylglutathione hydrolase FrmB